jgi:CRP/FNR family transcriptional regulator, cyclic AMP receptor protein
MTAKRTDSNAPHAVAAVNRPAGAAASAVYAGAAPMTHTHGSLTHLLPAVATAPSRSHGSGPVGDDTHVGLTTSAGPWRPTIADLRVELAHDTPQIMNLDHPLPARLVELPPGKTGLDLIERAGASCGLLVLDGLLLVELASGRAQIGWLVGEGDLVQPSAMHEIALTQGSRWRALTETRLAVLDREFLRHAGGIPIVSRALVRRAGRAANWLLAKSLIISSPLIEERLLLLLALLAERWGRVTPEGVVLRLPLTHATLATLSGARRPSVTLALHALEDQGLLSCPERCTWLLHRRRSDNRSRHTCLTEYERSLGLSVLDGAATRAGSVPAF